MKEKLLFILFLYIAGCAIWGTIKFLAFICETFH